MSEAEARSAPRRARDAERTRADILAVAQAEFAEHGLAGARVDAIAARTHTTKRMIYYYFGSKERLYLAVLERAYGAIRHAEQALDLAALPPEAAMRRLVEFTFDYDEANPDFVRLVSIENIHRARFIGRSPDLRAVNATALDTLGAILTRGQAEGVFRTDLEPLDVHMLISAFCIFRVANRHTFGRLFDMDLSAPPLRSRHRRVIADAVVALVASSARRRADQDPGVRQIR